MLVMEIYEFFYKALQFHIINLQTFSSNSNKINKKKLTKNRHRDLLDLDSDLESQNHLLWSSVENKNENLSAIRNKYQIGAN